MWQRQVPLKGMAVHLLACQEPLKLVSEFAELALGEGDGVEGEVKIPSTPVDLVPEVCLLPAHGRAPG